MSRKWGVKSGKVPVTDSVGQQQPNPPTECVNNVSVIDSRCDFGFIPNPSTIKMTFVGNSAVSRKSNISVYPPECSQTITLSPTSMNIVDSRGVTVPVTLNFFTGGSSNPDTVIEPGTYVRGLDMNVTAGSLIATGKYPMLLTGTGNAVDPLYRNKPTTERPLTIILDVATTTPKFQEF